ncbi:MAG: hypothetical protein EOO05_06740 [Chitinophagaceae bacterium]|nr:MAG: hypothetical protein EOO05_06740 [Chitinophagaceae bacterium]
MPLKNLFLFTLLVFSSVIVSGQKSDITNDARRAKLFFGNGKLQLELDYHGQVNISLLQVNGQKVIAGDTGVYSAFQLGGTVFSTLHLAADPTVRIKGNKVIVSGIHYGNDRLTVTERWTFTITPDSIRFGIDRTLSDAALVEKMSVPVFTFNNINTWEGAYQDYGGLAWFYLFNKKLDTYGVHSSSSRFWDSRTGNGLKVSVQVSGQQVAMDYRRTMTDQLAYSIMFDRNEALPRFDPGTNRRRYTRDTSVSVWSPVHVTAGKTHQEISLRYFDFAQEFNRGKLAGINGEQVSAVLNTIARIGVIDKQHFGGNSWHTPYGPICLHEQYIAQMGLAINDNTYLTGYRDCLDFYRDNAIRPDGRVWPRWAYSNEDAMPGVYTDKGFYEAQWGYLLDSNPDYVMNVSELYDQNGDLAWVRSHKQSCEKALDWILQRDSNGNGLVEMMTDHTAQRKGSDWIDIIWASFENAFVNAKLYRSLRLWSAIEEQLGDRARSLSYHNAAVKLKTAFNKPASQGGFWDEQNKCYVHWLDKDGSKHGRNMVTPVNFMAIAYGICDDRSRAQQILDDIETGMVRENLFFWPLCMTSYGPGEGNDWQFPFPEYENGDLFLSWGSVAVKAYAMYKPELALKYVYNVLNQYSKDGLAFQRYGRKQQDGRGDDILSGNSLSVVGLYQSIYGVNPLYNRFYLDPHITTALAGTELKYWYRNQQLTIGLDTNKYTVSNDRFSVTDQHDFGFSAERYKLSYFHGNSVTPSFTLKDYSKDKITVEFIEWTDSVVSWKQECRPALKRQISYTIGGLQPDTRYWLFIDKSLRRELRSDKNGIIVTGSGYGTGLYELKKLER